MDWRDGEQRWAYVGWAAMGAGGLVFWGGLAWSLALGRALSRPGAVRSGHRVPILLQDEAQLGLPERAADRAP